VDRRGGEHAWTGTPPFVTVRIERAGMMWVPDYLAELAEQSGARGRAAGQGCPAMEFIQPLIDKGLTVHALEGSQFALATGRMKDRVRDSEAGPRSSSRPSTSGSRAA
jgi:hypothetical protein